MFTPFQETRRTTRGGSRMELVRRETRLGVLRPLWLSGDAGLLRPYDYGMHDTRVRPPLFRVWVPCQCRVMSRQTNLHPTQK